MGQIYSFLGYTNTAENNNLEALFTENFSCKICLEVLHDPVQCQNNEHYFCRKCITKHLGNSETCPLCMDQLTLETLRPPSRIIANVVSKMKKPQKQPTSILIFGGALDDDEIGKSVEVLDWSTRKWTLLKNCLFFRRHKSFLFLHGKKIMICGGDKTERIEYLNPSQYGYASTVASVSLPVDAKYNGVLYGNRIFTFDYGGVVEISLESPRKSRTLIAKILHKKCRNFAGVHCFGNDIYIVGEQGNKMEKYDVAKNELKTLPSLPYTVYNMATVAYEDNIIILGGDSGPDEWYRCPPRNDVVMFNVTTHEYRKLPSMLEKRSGCAAVIMHDRIIMVMGGDTENDQSEWTKLNTVEYFVLGESAWHKLPAMNLPRVGATACVYG